MAEQRRRLAIVMRGPTGTGKSTTRDAIRAQWKGTYGEVTLDHGWGEPNPRVDEFRRLGKTPEERYRDLAPRQEELLMVELGWGEPAIVGTGSTYRPREWIDLLESDGRGVVLFRLSVERAAWVARVTGRRAPPSAGDTQHYERIEHDADGIRFPGRARLPETVIDTTETAPTDAAITIFGIVEALMRRSESSPAASGSLGGTKG